ncbi:hypothetical protein Hanom_Chr10g00932051 [Helianthus anomalus]
MLIKPWKEGRLYYVSRNDVLLKSSNASSLFGKNDSWRCTPKNIITHGNARTFSLEVVQNLLSSTSVAAWLLVTMVSSSIVVTI